MCSTSSIFKGLALETTCICSTVTKKNLIDYHKFYILQRSHLTVVFISLIRMRSKRDIKMGRLCTPGGAVLGIVGGGCDVPFFKW